MTRKPKPEMTRMIISLPKALKAKLDKLTVNGYSISLSEFVRVAIETALQRLEAERKGLASKRQSN